MKRNLRFWTRFTWESMGVDVGMVGLLAVIALFSTDGLDLRLFATVVPYFLCIAGIFGMMMINIGSQALYVPLLLSMGETRRNVLLGFLYYRALIIAVTAAICSLIWLLVPGEVSATGLKSIPTLLCVLAIASAASSIMGTLFVKWKWLGIVLIIVLCGGAGGLIGMSSVALAKGSFLGSAETLVLAELLVKLPWQLAAAALALLVLDLLFQWAILRKREVKL